jgi:hypothetical protein
MQDQELPLQWTNSFAAYMLPVNTSE